MDITVLLTLLGGVALAVNRIVELVKPAIQSYLPDERMHAIVIRALSILLGVIITVGGGEQFNLLAASPVYGRLNPTVGLVISGIIVGAFSNGWDRVATLVNRPEITSSRLEVSKIEATTECSGKE